ncbi:hypothetical protein [Hominifimenecus sp. rT4P-3]|uniref:hypothetical protein n=1 Tax=Hominifimenecus sp. rT4P-3 TaxID=3242979 RepID=UPI003DA35DDD
MSIRKCQQQAAVFTDELLNISEDIEEYVIAVYGTISQEMFDMQCRVQLERCKRLAEKLQKLQEELEYEKPAYAGESHFFEPAEAERQKSAAITLQMIAQNRIVLGQKENLLKEFLTHSDLVGEQVKNSKEMSDMAEIIRLQDTLRGELDRCQTEKEK